MKSKKFMSGKLLLQWIPAVTILAFVLIGIRFRKDFSLEHLLSITPDEKITATLFLLLLFILKALSIVFPILVIYALSGIIFSPPVALLVNLIGTCLVILVPYLLGRLSGSTLIQNISQKYPRAQRLHDFQRENVWFFSFFLRVIGLLPGDIISMYQGAGKFPLLPCLVGGIGGMLPAMLASTFLGENITHPGSPQFLLSVSAIVCLSVSSILFYRWWKRSTKKKNARKEDSHDTP